MSDAIITAIFDWNPWLQGPFPEVLLGFKRDYNLLALLELPEIKILEGARRAGKSTLMYQIIAHLHAQGKRVLYLNFDDEELGKHTLKDIYYAYRQKEPIDYLFLDEVQQCSEWVHFVRKLYDTRQINQLWISGSNSSLIKKDYKTLLTGRNITLDIFPLSFREYLRFNQHKNTTLPLSSAHEANVIALFQRYLAFGAFPAVTLRSVYQKELLINYLEDILYKDIMTRYDVDATKLKELALFLCSQSAKEFSYRNIANVLKLHANTVTEYMSYFKEVFLFQEVYRFDYSLKQQLINNKKIYALDVGLAAANAFHFSDDHGRKLENLVYNELKRRGLTIYFHRLHKECDFIIKQELAIVQAIQVTYSLSDETTRKREIAGLLEALQHYQLREGWILTMHEEMHMTIDTYEIHVLPVWKWLLLNNAA